MRQAAGAWVAGRPEAVIGSAGRNPPPASGSPLVVGPAIPLLHVDYSGEHSIDTGANFRAEPPRAPPGTVAIMRFVTF
jgi:hypothetical protein